MSGADISNVREVWHTFLMDAELAKHYKMANMVSGFGQLAAPNPILEALLPSLLYVRLGALLDQAFEHYILADRLATGKAYGTDFDGRIKLLNDQGLLRMRRRSTH